MDTSRRRLRVTHERENKEQKKSGQQSKDVILSPQCTNVLSSQELEKGGRERQGLVAQERTRSSAENYRDLNEKRGGDKS